MPTIYRPRKKPQNKSGDDYRLRQSIYQTARWRTLRLVKLADSPLCERCATEGRVVPAIDVHHIKSFTSTDDPIERKRLAYDYENLMSLCKECHRDIHHGCDSVQGGMG